jgi:Ca2+-binding RTX toxin-like protein
VAGLATVAGGAKVATLAHAPRMAALAGVTKTSAFGVGLSSAEHQAAQDALAKLGGKVPDAWSGANRTSALKPLHAGSGLVAGHGHDTFAGGGSGLLPAHFASDTVAGASAGDLPPAHGSSVFHLSAETINVAGATAAGVKAQHPHVAHHASHTITLTDKTTLNITGVPSHHIVKH